MPDPLDNSADTADQHDAGSESDQSQARGQGEGSDDDGASEGSKPSPRANRVEAEARSQGWRPKEEFTGDPDKWVDASTFVDRGNSFKSNLVNKVAALEKQIEAFKGTAAQFAKHHKDTMEKKDKELAAAIRQLKIQKSEAAADGDHQAAVEYEDRIDTLNQERAEAKRLEEEALAQAQAAAKAAEAPQVDPILQAWIEDGNEWFDNDPKLRRYAMGVAGQLREDGTKLTGRPFLDRILLEVKADFPEKFTNPNRGKAAAVDTGAAGKSKTGRTAADLPEEDRTLMKRFVKEGLLTEKQFLADYKWSN